MQNLGSVAAEVAKRGIAMAEEHDRRLREDPAYREGWEIREKEAREVEDARAIKSIERAWTEYGIPRRLWPMFEAGPPEDRKAIQVTREWLAGPKTFLIMAGDRGIGKTVASAWAVKEEGGLFRKARDIAWLSQFDTEGRDVLLRANVLAIDDLGTEPLDDKGWALSMIYAVLDHRYDSARKTLITTNLSVDAMGQRYGKDGGRLFRRFKETGDWIELGAA